MMLPVMMMTVPVTTKPSRQHPSWKPLVTMFGTARELQAEVLRVSSFFQKRKVFFDFQK
jgi:hypothetical protein